MDIHMNTCTDIKSHYESLKTLRMHMGWSSLASAQKKNISSSCFWTLKNISAFCNFLKYFQHVLSQLSYAPRELWKYQRLMELPQWAVAQLCPGQETEEHFKLMLKIQILSKSLESRCQLWITWLLCHIFPGYAHWLRYGIIFHLQNMLHIQ